MKEKWFLAFVFSFLGEKVEILEDRLPRQNMEGNYLEGQERRL